MKKLFFVTLLIQFNFIQSDYSVHPRADFVVNELVNSYGFDEKEVMDVLKNAKKHFSDSFVKELDNKIEPYHLPVTDSHVSSEVKKPFVDGLGKQTIVFNHRTKTYRDFKNFILKICDPLYEKRQDFKVWIPLLDLAQMKEIGDMSWQDRLVKNGGYIDDTKFDDKESYHNYLSQCKVGYSPPQKYNG